MTTDLAQARQWAPALSELAGRIRNAARGAMREAFASGDLERVTRPVGMGAGDVTFGVDEPTEEVLSTWLTERARSAPLSLMTEDAGWRHLGPDGAGGTTELPGFDHSGPRIAVDPIDGTRNLMADLRSAWSVIAFCGPGAGQPSMSDVCLGLVSEIPDSRAALFRSLEAFRGAGCRVQIIHLESGELREERALESDDEARVDNGYFPFFAYMHDLRPPLAQLQADFFARLARDEGADVRSCYDDQYISNGGQLVLLASGTYRLIVDARQWVARQAGQSTITSKPYDLAGAVLCAREAGCVFTTIDGAALDFPLDTSTPIEWVGYANRATHDRLRPHLEAALESVFGRGGSANR